MPPTDGKTKRADGKSGRVAKRSGKGRADGKRSAAKGDEGLDYGPPVLRRGIFQAGLPASCPLRNLMYGAGDALPEDQCSETVDLVEDIVADYCTTVLQKAVDQAAIRGQRLQPEDILFCLRKDPKKFARGKELLSMHEEIKQARKQFEEDDAIMRR